MLSRVYAGFSKTEISPSIGSELCGYGMYLERCAESILTPLMTRSIVVSDGFNKICIISCDLIGLDYEYVVKLQSELSKIIEIPVGNIMISCTHIHAGPATCYTLDGCLGRQDKNYMNSLFTKILKTAEAANKNIMPAKIGFAAKNISGIGYNRVLNSDLLKEDVLVLRIDIEDQRKLAIINYACHPVSLGVTRKISADFPGYLIQKILNENGISGFFLQGFAGDINPSNIRGGNHYDLENNETACRQFGSKLADAVVEVYKNIDCCNRAKISVTNTTKKIKLQIFSEQEVINSRCLGGERFHQIWQKKAIERLSERCCFFKVPIQIIKIGQLVISALPGEVFHEFGTKIRKVYQHVLTAGYSGGNIGYIPDTSSYKNENNYAAYLAPRFYPTVFPLAPDAGEILTEEIITLIKNMN